MRNSVKAIGLGLLVLGMSACGAGAAASSGSGTTAPPVSTGSATGASAMTQWWTSYKADFNALQPDEGAISTDAKNSDAAALATDCQTFVTDVGTMQADPPVPVAAINTPFQAGLTSYAKAGQECINGDYNSSATDLATGNSYINQATGQIKALTGQS